VPGIFVDTNVFFYAYDDRDSGRQQRSRLWIEAISDLQIGVANLQVANEFTSVVLRRMPNLPADTVFQIADNILSWGTGSVTVQTTTKAREIRKALRYSRWDCLLLASALELGCSHFLSEDLQDGHRIESLTIIDPFAHSPDQILALR
jgi:predicted nucleic acid-binding protein